jgi:hypothetical protein
VLVLWLKSSKNVYEDKQWLMKTIHCFMTVGVETTTATASITCMF